VKGIEKITSVRLAEILSERGEVSAEAITDALYSQDKHGEPFVEVLLDGGKITEWDLAKIVTEHFSLPFLMASNYQISDAARDRLPKDLLFKHTLGDRRFRARPRSRRPFRPATAVRSGGSFQPRAPL
jgi:hypothetical protein